MTQNRRIAEPNPYTGFARLWNLRLKWRVCLWLNRLEQFNIRVFVVSVKRLEFFVRNLGR